MAETFKVCTICDQPKPLDEFRKAKTGKHGRSAQCKACVNRRQRAARSGWRGPVARLPSRVRF